MICFFFAFFCLSFALIYFECVYERTARWMIWMSVFEWMLSVFCLWCALLLLLFLCASRFPTLYFIPSTHHCVTMINYSWKSVYHSDSVYRSVSMLFSADRWQCFCYCCFVCALSVFFLNSSFSFSAISQFHSTGLWAECVWLHVLFTLLCFVLTV